MRTAHYSFGIALLGLSALLSAHATPFVPKRDEQVLERLPAAANTEARELRSLRLQLVKNPTELALAARLARRYVEIGRAESDPRYYGYAEGVLQPWWRLKEPPSEVLVLRATIRQNRHDFENALKDLSQLLARDRRNAQGWLTQAVILQVRGEYGAAKSSCLPLVHLADTLSAITCLSSVGGLSGEAPKSYELLRQSLHGATAVNAAQKSWSLTALAEIAVRMGRMAEAERHFQEALALGQRDVYLLAAYADWLLDQDRPGEVVALLKDQTRADGLLLRLALAEQRLGSEAFPGHLASLRARFAAARMRGDTLHQGEEARFTLHLLNDAGEALRLAQANWSVQREPRDGRVLLEAAIAAKDPAAARPVLELLAGAWSDDAQLSRLARRLPVAR